MEKNQFEVKIWNPTANITESWIKKKNFSALDNAKDYIAKQMKDLNCAGYEILDKTKNEKTAQFKKWVVLGWHNTHDVVLVADAQKMCKPNAREFKDGFEIRLYSLIGDVDKGYEVIPYSIAKRQVKIGDGSDIESIAMDSFREWKMAKYEGYNNKSEIAYYNGFKDKKFIGKLKKCPTNTEFFEKLQKVNDEVKYIVKNQNKTKIKEKSKSNDYGMGM